MNSETPEYRRITVPERWTLHSYYSLCPWAPDGSGRLLLSGADMNAREGEVLILSPENDILTRIGPIPLTESFWHTGFWQTWGPGAKTIYYQAGTLREPVMVKHDLSTGNEERLDGGMQGSPPFGEPIHSGLIGMLYGAGYGTGVYNPELFPVPIHERDKHGLFSHTFDPPRRELSLSVQDVLDTHPDRDKLLAADREVRARLGGDEGLTLMLYCLRWNRQGTRCLFYFGNHCVVKERGEPRVSYVMTADKDLKDIRLALDISFERRGVHWSWQADGERLIGYGPDPEGSKEGYALHQVRYDGTEYQKICGHGSGGHPSVSPANGRLVVTDESRIPGRVVFFDAATGRELAACSPGRVFGESEQSGRNPYRVCHHPVFSPDGKTVLVNTLNATGTGPLAQVATIDVRSLLEELG